MELSSVWEVQGLSSLTVIVFFTHNAVILSLSRYEMSRWRKFTLDFSILILPLLLSFTIFHAYWPVIAVTLSSLSFYLFLKSFINVKISTIKSIACYHVPLLTGYLSNYRAYILIVTNIVILAVDFSIIFPAKFAKSDRYGSSLMDVAVGCFVMVSNGMMSPAARGRQDSFRTISSKFKNIKRTLVSSAVLVALGSARLVATTLLNYRLDVNEYGIHWNFFFTLAAVKVTCGVILQFIHPRLSWILAVLFIASYEFVLSNFGLRDYIFDGYTPHSTERVDLIDANREGIFSCIGYVSLYFAGVTFGRFLFLVKRHTIKDWLVFMLQTCLYSLLFMTLLHLSVTHCDGISRKIANLSFVLWIIMYNFINLALLLFAEILLLFALLIQRFERLKTPGSSPKILTVPSPDFVCETINHPFCLLRATTYNGLFYFLLGNVLTGVVNMSCDASKMDTLPAISILTLYMFIVCSVSVVLYEHKVSVKV